MQNWIPSEADNWWVALQNRAPRTLVESDLPAKLIEAYETVKHIAIELASAERMYLPKKEPWGSAQAFLLPRDRPAAWLYGHPVRKHLDLEIARNAEQQAEHEAWLAAQEAEWEETKALISQARDTYYLMEPLLQASERLNRKLRELCYTGRPLVHPEVLHALFRFRDGIAQYENRVAKGIGGGYVSEPNPVVAAYLCRLDQMLDRLGDTVRQILLRRIFDGTMTTEQEREAAALLQAQADAGIWADPEGDMDRAAARVA